MSDAESIAWDAAYDQAMAEEEAEMRQAVIENLENDLYWATHAGPDAASLKRTQTAEDYWKPYQKIYRQLREGGMKPGKARMVVDKQIFDDKSWPPDYLKNRKDIGLDPSKRALEKWLK